VTRLLGGAIAVAASLSLAAGAGASSSVAVDHVTMSTAAALPSVVTSAAQAAWCGAAAQSDRAPNAVAGNPVHWIYAIPSDGADNLSGLASTMQADAEQIDTWWRGQDPTRTPRNDVALFSCGTQLDITTLRTTRSSAQLMPLEARFSDIYDELLRARLDSSLTKYVVYYDGPADEPNVCGQGGSDASGFGLAIVYFRSCSGVSTAAVAAHEFLHAIGAVPTGAPHECTGANSAHVCDTAADIMYPSLGGAPLSSKTLDPGRDDYYGHSSSWIDTQDSAWLVRLDGQTPLALTVSGPGSVSADVPGLLCAASCTTTWNAGQRLALSATPSAGAKLVRWGGACAGAAGCNLTVAAGTSVSAVFGPSTFRLTVAVAGKGLVRSSSSGIACRPRCSASLPSFTAVRLTAAPAKGWKLRSWSGACHGSKTSCTVPMSGATSARALFVRR
jgi:hypothetical protein